ncbi:Clavaminate synthase-like protein [Glonium stellatum]|uniref:Clavaminate synthase-like protein n=1 Tax=Glonium stellatum TaxID=574774 RepID=A0A8E2FBE4_9PEZI|nr:Clavaminate synthase-like protein [Glonium stellatum]
MAAGAVNENTVTVSLTDLRQGNVKFSTLEEAFGPSSLGIIIVKDLPLRFNHLRHKMLSYSSFLAGLSSAQLATLESPISKWLVGWSCGKETLKNGRYDTLKGSYYVNCSPAFEDAALRGSISEKYPSFSEYTAPNVWPPEELLSGFEDTFRELCNLITEIAALVAKACDGYSVAHIDGYPHGYLEHVVKTSVSTKARLLHYYPPPESYDATDATASEDDDWCATHLDHGCLTGLTSAMFVDEAANPPSISNQHFTLPELDSSPDPKSGLYIHSRAGVVTKVNIPRDCLAFQTGEALEVITKGRFKAVPHFVRGLRQQMGDRKVARNTLAVFTQPNLWEMVDEKRDFATFAKEIVERNH